MADLNENLAPGSVTLHVAGVRQDGGVAALASVTFTVESGTASLADGPDSQSQVISVSDSNPTVIRVDANANLTGGTRIITARLLLNGAVIVPSNEAVSLTLTTD
jgi:hypothetical protein